MRILIKNHDLEVEKQYPGISLQSIEITECRAWWRFDTDHPYCLKEYNKFEIFLVILGNHFMVSGRITYEYSRNIYIYEKKVYT